MYRTHFLSKDLDKVGYYKKYSNTLNKLKWTCKSSYYKQQFELNKNNLKNTWKLIGTIINRKPKVFQNYLVEVSDIHSHNTRYASNFNFHVPRVRSNYGKHTFKFAINRTWEEIPTKIKTLSYHKFKKEYKRILVNSQR